jgi:hypothetical protein
VSGNSIDRRLVRLEAASPLQRRVFVWRELGQTSEQSIAGRFPEGVPADAQVTLLSWQGVVGQDARPKRALVSCIKAKGLKLSDSGCVP